MIENVNYHITDRCNLKCASCGSFCPLISDNAEDLSMEQIEKDLSALSKYKEYIKRITILGGEPTLHPKLNEILYLTRKLFPDNVLHLTTNCTTWNKFEQWKDAIIENDFYLTLSSYPYCESYKENIQYIINLIGENRCTVRGTNKLQKGPFVLRRNNTDEEILNCHRRGNCCQLKNEHLYICNYAANIDYLYNEFPLLKNYIFREGYEKIDLTLNDITINDVECMLYLNIPALCFACNECKKSLEETQMQADWKCSNKKIDEWIN